MSGQDYEDIVRNELTLVGHVYYAKFKEMNTKLMAINRRKRINAINIHLCGDAENTGFNNWELVEKIGNPNNCLCICGMELEKEAFFLTRKDMAIQHCIGSKCIEEMDKEYKTRITVNIKDDIKREKQAERDKKKECPFCMKKKTMKEEMCKVCSSRILCELCKTPNYTSEYRLCKPCWSIKDLEKHTHELIDNKCIDCNKVIDQKYVKCYNCKFKKDLQLQAGQAQAGQAQAGQAQAGQAQNKCIDCNKNIEKKYTKCYGCKFKK